MVDKDSLKPGDTIWQVDINGSNVSLRKIAVEHLYQITGKYWVSCEQEGLMDGMMLKVDSHLLFHTKKQAIVYMSALWHSLAEVLTNETE